MSNEKNINDSKKIIMKENKKKKYKTNHNK